MSAPEKIKEENPISSDISSEREQGKERSLKDNFRIEKKRLNWIDQGRGMVMFLLVFSELMPSIWRQGNWFSDFALDHPPADAHWMNLYDVGVPAFFFIIGLMLVVSFKKRREQKGTRNAVLNAILRWGMIFILGALIILMTYSQGFYEVKIIDGQSMIVVSWDVIIAIGFIGLLSIPFMFLSNKARLIISYAMMAFYQIMLYVPGLYWRDYAAASVHGGIIGGIFVMTAFILIGSCIGEYYVLDKDTPTRVKNRNLIYFALLNIAIGVGLWLTPDGYPNKRQSTMGWAVISIAVVVIGLLIFIFLDYKDEDFPTLNPANRGRIILFKAYGQNPFLIYTLTVVPGAVLGAVLPKAIQNLLLNQIVLWIGMVSIITGIALLLYWNGKAISTTKVAGGVILIIVILYVAVVLPGFVSI